MKTPPAPGSRPTNTKPAAASRADAGPVVVEFVFERDTKNTTRFQEVVADGETPRIGTLYLNKATGIVGDVRVRVTVEAM